MGMIALAPNAEDPVRIMRNSAGPDTSALQYHRDIRRRAPAMELLTFWGRRTVYYVFWTSLPLYIFLQKEELYPYPYIHHVSIPAVCLLAFLLFMQVCPRGPGHWTGAGLRPKLLRVLWSVSQA